MKRLTSILAISVIAVMSAGAARADIASTTYVDNKVSPVSTKANTNAGEIATLKSDKQDKLGYKAENAANKVVSGGDMEKALKEADADTKYPTLKAALEVAQIAAGAATATYGELANHDTVSTNLIDNGAVTTEKIAAGTIVNANIAANAAIDQSKIAGLADSIADAKGAGTAATSALNDYKTSNDTALGAVKKTADDTAAAVNNAKTGLAATKKIADDNAAKLATMATSATVNDLTARVGTAESNITSLQSGKQNKLVSGENGNINGSNGVSVTVGTDGKIAVSGNQSAIDTAIGKKADTATVNAELAKKQNTLTEAQLEAANSSITKAKVTAYDGYDAKITAAQTKANNAVVANAAITAGTGTKITYDAKGLVTGSASLAESDIPTLATSKISGLDTALAGKIPVPSETNTKGKLVLTYDSDTKAYAWESIGR